MFSRVGFTLVLFFFLYILGFVILRAFGEFRWRAETKRHTHQAGPHESNLLWKQNKETLYVKGLVVEKDKLRKGEIIISLISA